MSVNLQQWVKASVFRQLKADGLDKILPTGFYQNAPEALNAGELERIEFRFDGPYTRLRSNKTDRHDFELNLLITAQVTPNIYAFDALIDKVRNAVKESYCIFKIDQDHQTEPFEIVGTLKVLKSIRRQLYVHNLGLIEANRQLYQAVVAGRYYIDLPRS